MTTQNPESGDFRRDELIAGEYVLGVLSAEDRRKVEARIVLDQSFAAMVGRWQDNLSSLADDYAPVAPPPRVLATIERRLFADTVAAAPVSGGFWNSLVLWRGLTFASLLAVAALVALDNRVLPGKPEGRPLVVELAGQGNALSLLARYDEASGVLRVTPVASRATDEKSLELWLIDGDKPAQSLGVLPQTGEGEIVIAPDLRAGFSEGATLAVSVEPFGGSPTGSATGPVIALGKARSL